tara:strand:+ start:630 stop:956 length:327 start_codon:yes stop_codon:yes gene_type:complete
MSIKGYFTGGLITLKAWVIIAHLLSWNLFFGIALYIGGLDAPFENATSRYLVAFITLFTSAFFFSVVFSTNVKNLVINKNNIKDYKDFDFILSGAILAVLGLAFCFFK